MVDQYQILAQNVFVFFPGFNAAKLAGLPADIIRAGYAKAKQFEQDEVRRSVFKEMFAPRAEEAIGRLAERIAGL